MVKVYGIPNCDTVKKALNWMDANSISYEFHNYKKEGITATKLKEWSKEVGWQMLLNKKSSTWRKLTAEGQPEITSQAAAISLLQENTSLIKRPVITIDGAILVGFNEEQYKEQFKL